MWLGNGGTTNVNVQVPYDAAQANDWGVVPTQPTESADGTYINAGNGQPIYWNGTAWTSGASPYPPKNQAAPDTIYGPEPSITASDATNAAKLAGLGYVAVPQTAWTPGQFFAVNMGDHSFHWNGTAFASGSVPA
jgi:hypothetical protein